jgi:WD repeat and SOF domain-containing protein 1
MKFKTISRSETECVRETKQDIVKVHKNLNSSIHPMERAREYQRALNAVKLDRIFAKPFIASLTGHKDGVYSICKNPNSLSCILSGSCDGEIRVWNLPFHITTWNVIAHNGFVRGLCFNSDAEHFISCGDDKTIKLWNLNSNITILAKPSDYEDLEHKEEEKDKLCIHQWIGKHSFTSVDHKRKCNIFVTSGASQINVWDYEKSSPIYTFEWGSDSVTTVKFNPVELDVFASCATDRSVILYDIRGNTPIRKLIMKMKSNSICWNPMEAFNFTIASEDHNLYTFDMRYLDKALFVHKDHVSAVLDIDYSPTGREFCSGSYDRTVRIFNVEEGKSKEVYHTKRMQRIFCAKYTLDSKYILTGSDDTNIRIWKANASEPLKVKVAREQRSLNYQNKLKERYKYLPEIRRIMKHRHLPKPIYNAQKIKRDMELSQRRKLENRIKHSKPGTIKPPKEKTKNIISQIE